MVVFHLRGSWWRYAVALVLIGFLPLFKLTAFLAACGALAGFVERALQRRSKALAEVALAAVVPATVAIAGVSLGDVPFHGISAGQRQYLRGSSEDAPPPHTAIEYVDFLSAAEAAALRGVVLWLQGDNRIVRFFAIARHPAHRSGFRAWLRS